MATGRVVPGPAPKVAFVFSGQGASCDGLADFIASEPGVRDVIEHCDRVALREGSQSLMGALSGSGTNSDSADYTAVGQPALFALQMGLARMWQALGIEPDAVVGHSVGEVAAATFAGALSLDDGAALVVHRGQLLKRAASRDQGTAVIGLTAAETEDVIAPHAGKVWIAGINAPKTTGTLGRRSCHRQHPGPAAGEGHILQAAGTGFSRA